MLVVQLASGVVKRESKRERASENMTAAAIPSFSLTPMTVVLVHLLRVDRGECIHSISPLHLPLPLCLFSFLIHRPAIHSATTRNSLLYKFYPIPRFHTNFLLISKPPMRAIPATSHDSDRYFYVTIPHILRLVGWRRACFSWPIWTSLGQSLACKDRFFLRIDFTSNILMPIYHFNLYYLVPSLKSAKWCTVIFTARKMEKLV